MYFIAVKINSVIVCGISKDIDQRQIKKDTQILY